MNEHRCPYCNASLKKYWHKLTPGLVKTLVKIYEAISSNGENKVRPHKQMDLTTSEHMNMTKLRFHGLIAKVKANGEVERGNWLITKRGAQFLKGEIRVPDKVQTFRNKVVERSEDYVGLRDIIGTHPYFEKEFDFDLFENKQISLL